MHPILFKFSFITIYSYGFFTALAMAAAFFWISKQAPHSGISKEAAIDLLFILFIFGVIGARLFYVLQHWPLYQDRPLDIVLIQEGGLVWYGGFFLGALAGILYARARRLPVLALADFFSPVLALAHGIGRIGCFMNGCCFGRDNIPVQLFESAFLITLSSYLYIRLRRPHAGGDILMQYLLIYASGRFLLEFLRGDQTSYLGILTIPQWTSVVILAFCLLIKSTRKKRA